MLNRLVTLCLVGALTFAASACNLSRDSPGNSGFLGDIYDKLEPDPDNGDTLIWFADSDVLANYDKFMVAPVETHFAPEADGGDTSRENLKTLTDYLREQTVEALEDGGRYEVVDAAGPGVLVVEAALTSIDDSEWLLNIHPVSRLIGGGMGGASMEARLTDGASGDVVGAAMRTDGGGRVPITGWGTWADAERVMGEWAGSFRDRLDDAHDAAGK